MTDRNPGVLPDLTASHAAHDRLLIAAAAAGDLHGPDRERADRLLAGCSACVAVHDDLLAIAAATRSLPAPARPATRQFRIPPEVAARLARGRGWRRFLRAFGPGNSTARPLALGLSTLGVAGLLLASLPGLSFPLGGAGFGQAAAPGETREALTASDAGGELGSDGKVLSTGQPSMRLESAPGASFATDLGGGGGSGSGGGSGGVDTAGGESSNPGRSTAPDGPAESAGTSGDPDAANLPPTTDGPIPAGGGGTADDPSVPPESTGTPTRDGLAPPSPLVLLSVGFLAAGIGLFALRRAAARLR